MYIYTLGLSIVYLFSIFFLPGDIDKENKGLIVVRERITLDVISAYVYYVAYIGIHY